MAMRLPRCDLFQAISRRRVWLQSIFHGGYNRSETVHKWTVHSVLLWMMGCGCVVYWPLLAVASKIQLHMASPHLFLRKKSWYLYYNSKTLLTTGIKRKQPSTIIFVTLFISKGVTLAKKKSSNYDSGNF